MWTILETHIMVHVEFLLRQDVVASVSIRWQCLKSQCLYFIDEDLPTSSGTVIDPFSRCIRCLYI